MKRRTAESISETLRLAVGILFYFLVSPPLIKLFTGVPFIGEALSAIAAALITLLVWWLILPGSRIEITLIEYDTHVAVEGTPLQINCAPNTARIARYDTDIRFLGNGLLSRKLAERAVRAGLTLNLRIDQLETTVESGAGLAISSGITLPMTSSPPSQGTWYWQGLSFGTKDLAAVSSATVEPSIEVTSKGRWIYKRLIRPSCSVKSIKLVRI